MDRDEIIAALTALAHDLHERGITGDMYVVGGSAIALAYDTRRTTRDVDAVFDLPGRARRTLLRGGAFAED